jgi:hypothetical protein
MSYLVQDLEQFASTYYSDNNSEIIKQYISLKSYLQKHQDQENILSSNPEFLLFDEEFKAIQDQTSYLLRSNWSDVVKTPDLSIQTSRSENEFLTKLRFTVNASPLQVFSVLYENDLVGEWMKTMKASKTLRKISKFRKVIQNFYKLPWPLVNRHSILNVRYLLMPELHSILVLSYTPQDHMINPVNFDKYIEMVLPSASAWLKCIGDQSELTIIIQANKYIVTST